MDVEEQVIQVSARNTLVALVVLSLLMNAWRSGAFGGAMVLKGWRDPLWSYPALTHSGGTSLQLT